MRRILILTLYGPKAASTRYRALQYCGFLRDAGFHVEVNHLLKDDYLVRKYGGKSISYINLLLYGLDRLNKLLRAHNYDAIFLYGELFPLLPFPLERLLIRAPYIYDMDDAFFLKYQSGGLSCLGRILGGKIDAVVGGAHAVFVGNDYLYDYASRLNKNTLVVPTVVGRDSFSLRSQSDDGVFKVGWIGSPTTTKYLDILIKPMTQLAKEGPVRFTVIGGNAPYIPGVEVCEAPWSSDTEKGFISKFDVGVMPLTNDDWAKGKCGFKLIQYMSCGIPVIASAVGANMSIVDKSCGFLAETSDDWLAYLRVLRDDVKLRRSLGSAGRRRAKSSFTVHNNLASIVTAFNSLLNIKS